MWASRGSLWGPRALPEFLNDQLTDQGFTTEDSGRIARQINEQSGTSAAASLFVNLGSCKFLEGDIDGAIAAWRHAISSDNDAAAARALLNLGLLYEHLHLHARALGLLAAVADRNVEPYVAPAAMASARCQVAIGDAARAMETMARLAQRTMANHPDAPELIETLYGLGDIAEHAGRPDRAERSWRVAAASPTSAMQQAATDRLLQLLVDQGHDDEVRDVISQQADATQASARTVLAWVDVLHRLGDTAAACALAESVKGAELCPSDQFRLAAIKVQSGQVNLAIDDFESLLGHDDLGVQLRAAFSLGELYCSYDMHDAAMTMYERAADADDRYWSTKAALAIGDLLDSTGERDAALVHWRQAAASEIATVADQAAAHLADSPTPVAVEPDVTAAAVVEPTAAVADVVDLRESVVGADTAIAESMATAEPHIILLNSIDEDFTIESDSAVGDEPATIAPVPASVVVDSDHVVPSIASEPVVVVLSALEDDPAVSGPTDDGARTDKPSTKTAGAAAGQPIATRTSENGTGQASAPASAFANHLGDTPATNPYAALAPDDDVADVPAATRNPYAELAPNFDGDFEPPPDVEPGDWESMLEDWPRESASSDAPKPRSSAFSRYT